MPVGPAAPDGPWRICVDTGGTFTDCLALSPDGAVTRVKVLSSSALRGRARSGTDRSELIIEGPWDVPDRFFEGFRLRRLGDASEGAPVARHDAARSRIRLAEDAGADLVDGDGVELVCPEPAPLLAARLATGTPLADPLPPINLRLATTWGTNALLTRSGVPPVLVVNRGFSDLPAIGNQARPELFALDDRRTPPLHAEVVEVDGRLDASGAVVEPFDAEALRHRARKLAQAGRTAAAVALLHADKDPRHEREAARVLREAGFRHVVLSSEVAPFIRVLPRLQTAIVDAYLAPVILDYLERIGGALESGGLLVMTSAGGLARAEDFRPKDSLLSGPAGGIAGAARAGRASGMTRLLAFDMGGTSTDVARYDGDFEYAFEHRVGAAHLLAPALAIESVAAGGGSICSFDGLRLRVGPESASAWPGPACYGAGGPLTVTDLNLLLGRVDPSRFEIPIDAGAARRALERVRDDLARGGAASDADGLLDGLLDLANETMANAIRRISVRAGYDPEDFALVAFGGAGPQHAFAIADRLAMRTVLIPPHPGLLSANGLEAALVERFAHAQILAPLDSLGPQLASELSRLEREARAHLAGEGLAPERIVIRRRIASLRFVGQDAALDVEIGRPDALAEDFCGRYEDVYGHLPEGREVELVSLRVVASEARVAEAEAPDVVRRQTPAPKARTRRARFAGRWSDVPVYRREDLRAGMWLDGPCLVEERHSMSVVEPLWRVDVDGRGGLVGRRIEKSGAAQARRPEAAEIELASQALTRIAEEMGAALERSAVSTNVKERRDFSCAILDAEGQLLVNAPHIPVHLGSLGLCTRAVAGALALEPGDTAVTNHPSFGGSHLPDVTLVTPVHEGDRLLGYVVSRAHHAEIGGTLPGSMPPDARSLVEEGVVIPPTILVRRGIARWDELAELLTAAPHPTRALGDNLADLRAALAANHRGRTALAAFARDLGVETFRSRCTSLVARAERKAREALRGLGPLSSRAHESLDDGTPIEARVEIAGDAMHVDFSGSGGVHSGNLNATPAVVQSAVLYVLRLLIDEDLPLNEGLMRVVRLRLPRGLLDPDFPQDPAACPAVVGGNVEVSQKLVSALLGALSLAAASQGTMNNLLFGDDRRSYYETICGGCGAGPDFDGPSAVHAHMTNTRITDVEILEHRYPVRVRRFAIRRGSGGAGLHRGGDGVVREFEFLAPLELSLLTQNRVVAPPGLAGGEDGARGVQRLHRASGEVTELEPVCSHRVGPGDRLVIETPGGGGFGATPGDGDGA